MIGYGHIDRRFLRTLHSSHAIINMFEDEEYCECEESDGGFDSTLARERDNDFVEGYWPRSVADVRQDTADQMGYDSYKDMLASIGIKI